MWGLPTCGSLDQVTHAHVGRRATIGCVSRRDLLHVLDALARLAGDEPGVPVTVTAIDEAVGRGRGDMRTPLNLASLQADGLVESGTEGTWSLTAAGAARHREDEDYAGR